MTRKIPHKIPQVLQWNKPIPGVRLHNVAEIFERSLLNRWVTCRGPKRRQQSKDALGCFLHPKGVIRCEIQGQVQNLIKGGSEQAKSVNFNLQTLFFSACGIRSRFAPGPDGRHNPDLPGRETAGPVHSASSLRERKIRGRAPGERKSFRLTLRENRPTRFSGLLVMPCICVRLTYRSVSLRSLLRCLRDKIMPHRCAQVAERLQLTFTVALIHSCAKSPQLPKAYPHLYQK